MVALGVPKHLADKIFFGIEMGIERAVGQSCVAHDPGKSDRGDALLAKLPGRHVDNALPGRVLVSLLVPHLVPPPGSPPAVPRSRPCCITVVITYYDHNFTVELRSQVAMRAESNGFWPPVATGETMSLQKSAPIDASYADSALEPRSAALQPAATMGVGEAACITAVKTPATAPADAARIAILTGPILPTLLKQALPTMTVLLAQTAVNVAEAYYVGFLGTDALAGVALVFPVFMLMMMMSGGGLGSGVASAVARAVGAGHRRDGDALVLHALILSVIVGAIFTVGIIWGGPALYRALGGRNDALDAALKYSNYLFAGAIPVWIANLLSAALRGAGNVKIPALITLIGAVVLIPFSPILIFGFGPFPKLGIAGAGIAFALYYGAATLVLLYYMTTGRSGLTLKLTSLERRLFAHILRIGAPCIPIVAPAYAALALGFVIAFAAQGAGHVLWLFVGAASRLVLAAGCGWIAVSYYGAGVAALAAMVSASLVAYAMINTTAMASGAVWRK